MKNRSGSYKINLSGEMAYKSFTPNALPPVPPVEMSDEMIALLVKANSEIAVLESKSKYIPNISLFVSMYVRKEALLSSQIEGTQATLEDILDPMIETNTNRDIADVINYVKATEFAVKRLKELPLCNRLIREIHEILMSGIRGQEKNPGEFRRSQNWIGGQGSTLKNAVYIPPSPSELMQSMSDLEKYIHSDDKLNVLIRAALIHYQFETIHPFLDGNGRIGRLLIPLYLTNKGVIQRPILYMSAFFEKNRRVYYDKLSNVRINNDIVGWVKFFLVGVIETAKNSINTFNKILDLKEAVSEKLQKLGKRSASATTIVKYLYGSPLIKIKKIMEILNVSHGTAYSLVKELCEIGILVKLPRTATKDRYYVFKDYLNIFSERADDR